MSSELDEQVVPNSMVEELEAELEEYLEELDEPADLHNRVAVGTAEELYFKKERADYDSNIAADNISTKVADMLLESELGLDMADYNEIHAVLFEWLQADRGACSRLCSTGLGSNLSMEINYG